MQPADNPFPKKIFGLTTLLAILTRLVLWMVYRPVVYSDTPSYRRLAESVLNGFQRYDGTRTPSYPVFLAFVGSDQNVYLVQLLLGLSVTLLLFWMVWRLTNNSWLACCTALAHTLNLGQLFFEANLLTETFTTFWLVLTLAGTLLLLTKPRHWLWLSAGVGFTSAIAAITRPLFIYLPFWLLIIIILNTVNASTFAFEAKIPISKRIGALLSANFTRRVISLITALLIPPLLIIGSWVYFIHDRYHMWSLSTMTGYHMIQHTGNFFEYLPDEYADLRDTYLKYRQAHIVEYGTQTNTIWEAIPEMQKVSGLTFYDLSRKLSTLSIWLIVHHPGLFIRNVLKGWWLFWRAPVYWQPEAFRFSTLASFTSPVVLFERGLLVAANLLFIIASLPALFVKRLVPIENSQRAFQLCLVGTIWIGSVVQSLLDHGDNPRFLVPMQSLVIFWLFWFLYRSWSLIRKKA